MRTARTLIIVVIAGVLALAGCLQQAQQAKGPHADLRRPVDALAQTVIDKEFGVGLAIGVIHGDRGRVFTYGVTELGSDKKPYGNTVFQLGSITKTFAGILLADLVERGQIRLDDPAQKYLPEDVVLPKYGSREITLRDLATHSSGLPTDPPNGDAENPDGRFAQYTWDELRDFLASYELPQRPGEKYEYSNVGAGLLAQIICRIEGKDFETLVKEKICDPLKMDDTSIQLSPEQEERLAQAYDADLESVRLEQIQVLEGAGSLVSTVNDMLRYVRANMGLVTCPLAEAMASSQRPIQNTEKETLRVGLCWLVVTTPNLSFVFHNGETQGFHSFVAFDKKRTIAVVVLANCAGNVVDALGYRLMIALAGGPIESLDLPTAMSMSPEELDKYAGTYELRSGDPLLVSRKGDRLEAEIPGEFKQGLYPQTSNTFFRKELPVEEGLVRFVKDDKGQIRLMILKEQDTRITATKQD